MRCRRSSAPTATTRCESAHCCRTSPISATIWSARPSRSAAPSPACRSTCHDIALISDAIASRVDEVAKSITGALEERGSHITTALSHAGDNMILALGERGGDLLDRLEEASAETTRAVLDASERLTTSLNFKTGHVHDEFVDLADRVHEMLNERIDRITSEFEQRSST